MMTAPAPLFDYQSLASDVAVRVQRAAEDIRGRHRSVMESIIATGKALLSVKDDLEHGQFTGWLKSEFGWSESTARNYMRAADVFGDKSATVAVLPPATVYALASPDTPATFRTEVVQKIEAGDSVSPAEIRHALKQAKATRQQAAFEASKSPERKAKEARRRQRQQREMERHRREEEEKSARQEQARSAALDMLLDRFETEAEIDAFLALVIEGRIFGLDVCIRKHRALRRAR